MSKWQPLLGPAREATEIAEQDGQFALVAGRADLGALKVGGSSPRGRENGHDREVVVRPQLTRQPYIGCCLRPAECRGLLRARRRQEIGTCQDADPACRASPTAAAHRDMWDLTFAARLEHAVAQRNGHVAPHRRSGFECACVGRGRIARRGPPERPRWRRQSPRRGARVTHRVSRAPAKRHRGPAPRYRHDPRSPARLPRSRAEPTRAEAVPRGRAATSNAETNAWF